MKLLNENVVVMKNTLSDPNNYAPRTGLFGCTLLEAVDEVFSSFGDSCLQAIYYYLDNCFEIKRDEIPSRIEDFVNAIKSIFGPGAELIQIQIIQKLHSKAQSFTYCPINDKLSLGEYAEALSHFLL
jgi:hypothetical protein